MIHPKWVLIWGSPHQGKSNLPSRSICPQSWVASKPSFQPVMRAISKPNRLWPEDRVTPLQVNLNTCLPLGLNELRYVGGSHLEHMTTIWPLNWTQATSISLSLPLTLEYTFCPSFPKWKLFSRTQPRESNVLWRPSGQYMWLTQLGLLYKLLRFWRMYTEI